MVKLDAQVISGDSFFDDFSDTSIDQTYYQLTGGVMSIENDRLVVEPFSGQNAVLTVVHGIAPMPFSSSTPDAAESIVLGLIPFNNGVTDRMSDFLTVKHFNQDNVVIDAYNFNVEDSTVSTISGTGNSSQTGQKKNKIQNFSMSQNEASAESSGDFFYDLSVHQRDFQFLNGEVISLNNNEVWDDPEYEIKLDFDF